MGTVWQQPWPHPSIPGRSGTPSTGLQEHSPCRVLLAGVQVRGGSADTRSGTRGWEAPKSSPTGVRGYSAGWFGRAHTGAWTTDTTAMRHQHLHGDPNAAKLEASREATAQILRQPRDRGTGCGTDCTWEVPVEQQDKHFSRKWGGAWDPGVRQGRGSPSLKTLAQGRAGHGAAMGGMRTPRPLHPFVSEVTPEDSPEGRLVGLGTWMAPSVLAGAGHDAWSKGERAVREDCTLWRGTPEV